MKPKLLKKLKQETDRLIALFNEGKWAELEKTAREYVKKYPEHFFGWKVLGVSLQKQSKFAEAAASYRKALSIVSHDAEIYNNLGVALKEMTRFAEAETMVGKALEIKPDYAVAHNNLGNILRAQGRREEAMSHYVTALKLNPRLALAYNSIGNGYRESGLYNESVDAYRKALEIDPGMKETLQNLGSVLVDLGRLGEALFYLKKALDHGSEAAGTYNLIGNSLQGLGRYDEAEQAYRAGLDNDPANASLYTNIGNAQMQKGQVSDVIQSYRLALSSQPEFSAPLVHLAMASLPVVVATSQESMRVSQEFSNALDELEAFGNDDKWALLGQSITVRLPFNLSYRPGNHRAVLSRYGDIATRARLAWIGAESARLPPRSPDPRGNRLRLGVVCGQIHKHSVWFVMLKGFFSHLDRSKFELVVYYTDTVNDSETEYARSLADRFVQAPQNWLQLIKDDKPDILFYPELAMDLASMELALLRLAPLQVVTWGHPVTSGLSEIDLFFSGELLESSVADDHYREKLVRLPGTGACSILMDFGRKPLEASRLDLSGISNSTAKFLICQRPMKFDPGFDSLYPRIAQRCDAHFWFVRDQKIPWASGVVEQRINAAFEKAGLDPGAFVTWIDWVPGDQFWSLLEQMDVYLDTPAFSGFTTAWQSAYCGLPMVTLEGEFLRQRLAAGFLRKIGVVDTIASDEDEFVSIAAGLANDREKLQSVRQRLRESSAIAMEDVSVVRKFEEELLSAFTQ